VNFKNFFFFL
jgi:hypothetical protein